MSQRESVLAWPEEGPADASAQPNVQIERFKGGARKTILMLGDPVKRDMHWNGEIKRSVPCFRPAPCPFCSNPVFTKTLRLEGFAPVMVLNTRERQWEQAVAVFTKGGLGKLAELAPAGYRGWMLDVCKVQEQPGRTAPMQIKKLAPLPESFPALPPEFSVKAVMLREWFPQIEHDEPIQWIEPIKVERRARSVSTAQTMALDPEEAVLLAQRLRAAGMVNIAASVEKGEVAGAAPAAAEPAVEEKKGSDLKVVEIASDPKNYGPKVRLAGGVTNGDDGKSPGAELVGSLVDSIPAMRNGKKGGGK
jgi:hypothetical protein